MPLISNKTLNLSVIIVTFSVNLSDFSRSLNLSKDGHLSVLRNQFLRKFLARVKYRPKVVEVTLT